MVRQMRDSLSEIVQARPGEGSPAETVDRAPYRLCSRPPKALDHLHEPDNCWPAAFIPGPRTSGQATRTPGRPPNS